MTKYSIYLAGPLFSVAERAFNVSLARSLQQRNYRVFLPQQKQDTNTPAKRAFATDIEGIEAADVVVANMDGADPDSGTAWECGYAYARGIPTVLYRTDFRGIAEPNQSPYNLMLTVPATVLIGPDDIAGDDRYPNFERLVERLDAKLQSSKIKKAVARRKLADGRGRARSGVGR